MTLRLVRTGHSFSCPSICDACSKLEVAVMRIVSESNFKSLYASADTATTAVEKSLQTNSSLLKAATKSQSSIAKLNSLLKELNLVRKKLLYLKKLSEKDKSKKIQLNIKNLTSEPFLDDDPKIIRIRTTEIISDIEKEIFKINEIESYEPEKLKKGLDFVAYITLLTEKRIIKEYHSLTEILVTRENISAAQNNENIVKKLSSIYIKGAL